MYNFGAACYKTCAKTLYITHKLMTVLQAYNAYLHSDSGYMYSDMIAP